MKSSVVIATYNGEKFIEEQLDSILNQTIMVDEILISDDGSSDTTEKIIECYIKNNRLKNKMILQKNTENKGYAKNFLDTALKATGEIVFFCDQDDIWAKNRVEVMIEHMKKERGINLLCTNLEPFYYEKDTRKWDAKSLASMTNDGTLERCSLTPDNFHLKRSGCTMCIRKSFLEEIIPYWIPGWAHDDFVWKMAVISCSCAILQYNSMKRRMHSNNATVIRKRTREWRIKQLEEFKLEYKKLIDYAQICNLELDKIQIIEKNLKSVCIRKRIIEYHNVFLWPILYIKYKDCYPRIKGLYLDLYLGIFKEYKGVN